MATMSSNTEPSFEQLIDLFKPFDTGHNAEKYQLHNIGPDLPLRLASVLIPLFYKDGELHILLTVRSKGMSSHAGNVAFPGGMEDPNDPDAIATALREAHEEVGIIGSEVKVIAVLPRSAVRPSSLVTPILALIPSDFKPVMNPREVELVFDLPLKRFLSNRDKTIDQITLTNGGPEFNVYHFKDMIGDVSVDTWGFTALLCAQTAIVAYQSDMEFTVHDTNPTTRENCFNIVPTQLIIDHLKSRL